MRASLFFVLLALCASPFAWAQSAPDKPVSEKPPAENPAAQQAVDVAASKGLLWLANRQCANCHFQVPKVAALALDAEGKKLVWESSVAAVWDPHTGKRITWKDPWAGCTREAQDKEKVTYLGVSLGAVPDVVRRHVKLPPKMGLLVETVDPGSPAQAAGLVQHDLLLKFDEQLLVNPEQFTALVRTYQPAAEVKLTAIQKNEQKVLIAKLAAREVPVLFDGIQTNQSLYERHLNAALVNRSQGVAWGDFDGDGFADVFVANEKAAAAASNPQQSPAPAPRKMTITYLGVHTTSPPEALAKQLRLPAGLALMIESVEENTAAAKAGLLPFDVLQKMDDQLLVNAEQFTVLIRAHKPGDEVALALIREGKSQVVRVPLGKQETEVAADEAARVLNLHADLDRDGDPDFDLFSRRILARWLTAADEVHRTDQPDAGSSTDAEFIRRLYLDMMGLPPTADEVKAFLDDTSKDKRSKLVDKLLARPEAISRASGSWVVDWKDAQHALALVSKDGRRFLTARNLGDGKFLFEGPVDTVEQQKLVPAEVAGKFSALLIAQSDQPAQPAPRQDLLSRVLPQVEFADVPLKQAIQQLRKETGANLVVNWKALKQAGVNADEPVTLQLREVRLSSVLSTLLALASDEKAPLGYTVEGEVILISVKATR